MSLLQHYIQTACFLFSKKRWSEGGCNLTAATAGIREMAKLEYPLVLDRLPRILFDRHSQEKDARYCLCHPQAVCLLR